MRDVSPLLLILAGCVASEGPADPPSAVEVAAARLGPDHALAVTRTFVDGDGTQHVRVAQRYKGLPVVDATATIHLDPVGHELPMSDGLVGELDLDVTPRITVDQARAAAGVAADAAAELAIRVDKSRVRTTPRRDPLRDNAADYTRVVAGARLVYRVVDHLHVTLVDAATAAVIDVRDREEHVTGTANTFYSGTQPITTSGAEPIGFILLDPSRGNFSVYDAGSGSDAPWHDSNNDWGDGLAFSSGVTSRETAAADAFFGIEVTWDMFNHVFSWLGIDNHGAAPVVGVHAPTKENNSAYNEDGNVILVGDCPSCTGGTMAALDVIGHELTHGVDRASADLGSGEAENLNEANSDIFGTLAKIYFDKGGFAAHATSIPATTTADLDTDWKFGDVHLINLFMPAIPYYFSGIGDGSKHAGAGPMVRAFFFLAMGASFDVTARTWSHGLPWGMTGLGNDTAARIWFQTLTRFLQSDSDYAGARDATIQGVRSLFPQFGPEEKAVRDAFAGVDVGDPAVNAPAPPPVIEVPDNHHTFATAFLTSIGGSGPVAGIHKVDLLAAFRTGTDVILVLLPCGKSIGARLEASGGTYTLDAFNNDTTTKIAGGTTQNNDLVLTVGAKSCSSTGTRPVAFRVAESQTFAITAYILHLDLHD